MEDIRLYELALRSNVMVRNYETDRGKKIYVIIYDDHRWILNILFKYYRETDGSVLDVVTFDAHDDAASRVLKASEMLKDIGAEELIKASERQFNSFVEFSVGSDDGDWLTTACELDIVGNSCTIGNRNNNNIEDLNGVYNSESGRIHHLYELSDNLEFELGPRGRLGDSIKADEYSDLRKFFFEDGKVSMCPRRSNPFVLDFDLDYFTLETNKGTMAWTPNVWQKEFGQFSLSRTFISGLINQAEFITICREPDCCGNIGDSNKILEMLDYFLFDGQLGVRSPY